MKQMLTAFIILLISAGQAPGTMRTPEFTFHQLNADRPGNTLLVIGGIQGDEPGGFSAASLLVTHYEITKGNVWVVPNLNFISIIHRSRGIHGDLNRKFAAISGNDPEYAAIQKIKSIILDNRVDMVLNLHDGSGFYRTTYIDHLRNRNRWGQSIIIDQQRIDSGRFGHLEKIAGAVVKRVNQHVIDNAHAFRVKNTHTRLGNTEMAKTLTYFAVRHSKPAFGMEASKSFPTHRRAYYHVLALESFMDILGIAYKRKFTFSEIGIKDAIDKNVKLALYDRKIFLDIYNARKQLRYMPLKKDAEIEFIPSNPLITVVNSGSQYSVFHGNRKITRLMPQYFEYDSGIDTIHFVVDGCTQPVKFGKMVKVRQSFLVEPPEGYRANVIGFTKKGQKNESGISISKSDIQERFSIDKTGWIYRVEVYREDKFAGMVLVNFNQEKDRDILFSVHTDFIPTMRIAQFQQDAPQHATKRNAPTLDGR